MNPEKNNFTPEQGEKHKEALQEARAEHREVLREKLLEKAGEKSHENVEDVRHEALEKAASIEQEKRQHETAPQEVEHVEKGPISKAKREASFKAAMSEIRDQMPAPSRAFSKVIHNKVVEKVSDVAGGTIARPNAILTGAIFAFLLTLAVYLVAKNLGYPLSGFETIGAFILGWVVGVVYDFLKVMVTGRR